MKILREKHEKNKNIIESGLIIQHKKIKTLKSYEFTRKHETTTSYTTSQQESENNQIKINKSKRDMNKKSCSNEGEKKIGK